MKFDAIMKIYHKMKRGGNLSDSISEENSFEEEEDLNLKKILQIYKAFISQEGEQKEVVRVEGSVVSEKTTSDGSVVIHGNVGSIGSIGSVGGSGVSEKTTSVVIHGNVGSIGSIGSVGGQNHGVQRKDMKLILNVYNSIGEVLFFEKPGLVVTNPVGMVQTLIKSMINHEKIKDCKQEDSFKQKMITKGFYTKDFFRDRDTPGTQDEIYWSLLEETGIGTILTSNVMFVPLFIGDESQAEFHKFNQSEEIFVGDNRYTATYEFKNTKRNAINIFQNMATELAKKCKTRLCYSKNLEDRERDCLVSAVIGSTGLFENVERDGDQCLVHLENIKGQKIFCSSCKKARLCVLCSQGLKNCPNCVETELKSDPNEAQFIICQYQSTSGNECRNSVRVIVTGKKLSEVVEAVNELDQILELTARSLAGYLERKEGCFKCLFDAFGNIYLDAPPQNNPFCKHEEAQKTLRLVKEKGNFRNFEECSLKKDETSREFLDGALRITRTSYQQEFKFLGRIVRYTDFDKVSEFLKRQSMVIKEKHFSLINTYVSFFLDYSGTSHRPRTSE